MRVLGYIEWGIGGLASVGVWTTTNIRCVQLMGLGVRLPGQMVQAVAFSDSIQQIWAGGSPITEISISFGIIDPCNPVKITAQANVYPDPTSSQLALARLFRDATALAIGGMANGKMMPVSISSRMVFSPPGIFPNINIAGSVIFSASSMRLAAPPF